MTADPFPPELYPALVEAAPDPILVVDWTGIIVLANPAVRAVFGYTPEELVGQPIEVLLPTRMRDLHVAHRGAYTKEPSARVMGGRLDLVGMRRDGSEVPLDVSLSPLAAARPLTICVARDVTLRRKFEAELRALGLRDALTGLYNRAYLDLELERLDAGRHFPVTCFAFDLDHLKQVNDNHGHLAGDALLRRAAELLRSCFRADDMIARTGGDEFVALAPGSDERVALTIAQRLRAAMPRPGDAPGASDVSISFGWETALAPPIGPVLQIADERMYTAKRMSKRMRAVDPPP